MKELKLTLTLDEANLVLQALGQLPYVQVHELVRKIQMQSEPQLQNDNNNGSTKRDVKKETAQNSI
jgi:hypothetical protein